MSLSESRTNLTTEENLMVDEDGELNPKVQASLKEKGPDIVDLGSGTFDLYADLGRGKGIFIELKTANKSYKNQGWKDPDERKKGISLSSQTEAIWTEMKSESYPIVLVCDNDDINTCYLLLPDRLKELAEHRMGERDEDNILIGLRDDDTGELRFDEMQYEECIDKLVSFLESYNE